MSQETKVDADDSTVTTNNNDVTATNDSDNRQSTAAPIVGHYVDIDEKDCCDACLCTIVGFLLSFIFV